MGLVNGWNKVELNLAKASAVVNLQAINFLRYHHTNITGQAQSAVTNH